MATNAPVYSAFISSEYGFRLPQTEVIPASPNSGFQTITQFPLLPSGKLFKMRCFSFHINDPAAKHDSRGFVPYNDRTKSTSLGPAKVGQIVIESTGQLPCWKNLSSVNGQVNWPSIKRQIIGQFDADSGDNLQSPWTLITAPQAFPQFEISLRAANGVDFLVDRTNGGSLAPLDHWTIGVEFMPLTPEEIRTYFPYRNPFVASSFVVNYSDSIPDSDTYDISDSSAQGFSTMQRVWFKVDKNQVPNPYLNIDEIEFHAGGNGSSVDIVADIYNAIGDQTATNPTAAFAQMTPLGTTPQTTINDEQGGTQPVVLDTSAINNWGDQAIYVAIRQVGGQGYDLPANFTIEADAVQQDDVGATNDSQSQFDVQARGRPYYGDLNWT
jgi:hypothetical protein